MSIVPGDRGSRNGLRKLGWGRGLGKQALLPTATTTFHLLPASEARWPVATDRCKEAKSQVPGPIPPFPASAAPTPARPRTQPLCQAAGRARSLQCHTKLLLCPASSTGPGDVSLRDQISSREDGLWRLLAAEGTHLGAPPSWGRSVDYSWGSMITPLPLLFLEESPSV